MVRLEAAAGGTESLYVSGFLDGYGFGYKDVIFDMKWIKKWSYIILLVGTGVAYLSCVDNWQVYAKPLAQVRNWYEDSGLREMLAFAGTPGEMSESGSANETGPGSLPGQEGAETDAGSQTGQGSQEIPESGPTGSREPGESLEEGPSVVGEEGSASPGEAGESSAPSEGEISEEPGENGEVTGDGSGESSGSGAPDNGSENVEPDYMTVEDDYFGDAVFIGDSRTVGMFEYGGLEETAAFYASTGLTVYKMFESAIVSVPGQKKKITVEEALQQNTFAKIYLMIGINEMGTGTVESFLEAYSGAVAHLRELQPDAVIYLQGIIRVTAERSAQGDYINNEGIDARNQGIAQLADNEKVFYLDVNPLICDESGGMIPDYTFDGVHLKAKYIEIWKDYLKSHAISS